MGPEPDAKVGTLRFAFERTLGEGSGGFVMLARDRTTGARVALKTLHAVTADQVALLKNEFRAAQGLNHRNLVRLGELFEEGGRWFLSMEYVDGTDFLSYVSAGSMGFDESRLRSSLQQLASALRSLHDAGTVHRDIKPSNVLVTREGRVVVLDFGVALHRERARADDPGITGTALYMAPEQAMGERPGPAADWYAVGVMLFRALTGTHPFEGLPHQVLERKVLREAPLPGELAEGLPDDLTALAEGLLRSEPGERAGYEQAARCVRTSSVAPQSRRNAEVPLLGRERELAWLRDAFHASRKGTVAAVLHGESGVGKSLLLRTFVDRLEAETTRLLALFSRCYERSNVPFKAFDGAVDRLVEVLGLLSEAELSPWLTPHAGLLPRIFPELGLVPALAERAANVLVEEPKEARSLGFRALRRLLEGLSGSRPLLLSIDDLQWADADSLDLLRALLEPPQAASMLVLCTLRMGTETIGRGRELIERLPGDVRTLPLEKIPPGEARRFVEELCAQEGHALPDGEMLEALLREADGHPMFLTELILQAGQEHGRAPVRKLDDALRARTERLPAPAKRLLEVVCVAGFPVAAHTAAHAAALDGAELLSAIPELRLGRLVQSWGSGAEARIEPYHDRVRTSVTASMSTPQLRTWHGRLALSLEQAREETEPERLALHWRESGDRERALGYSLRAAGKANAVLAFERASRFYSDALELCDDEARARELRASLAEALTNAGRCGDAAELRLALAEKAGAAEALSLRTAAAELLLCSGRHDQGARLLEQVLKAVRVFVPISPLGILVSLLLARIVLRLRGLVPARRQTSIPPFTAAKIDALIAAAHGFSTSDTVRAGYFSTRALIGSLAAGDPSRLFKTFTLEAGLSAVRGHPARRRTEKLLGHMRELARRDKTPLGAGMLAGAQGYYHFWQGDWLPAREQLALAVRILSEECVGQFWGRTACQMLLFRSLQHTGAIKELDDRLRPALHDVEQRGDRLGLANMRSGPVLWLRLAKDETQIAQAELASVEALLSAARFTVQHYFHMSGRGNLELYRGEPQAARLCVEGSWRALRRALFLRVSMLRVFAYDLRARAALACAIESAEEARGPLLRQVEAHARSLSREGYACADGLAALLRAEVHALRGEPALALRNAEEAERAFTTVSMKLHGAASRWLQVCHLGGDEGSARIADARARMVSEGVVHPERFASMLASGVKGHGGETPPR